MLQLGGEPEFSFVDDVVFGPYTGPGANLRTISAYDFPRNTYTPLLDLDTVVPGLAETYVGGVSASAGAVEKVAAFFGGPMQGQHHYVVVFERRNPAARRILDTTASTLNGAPTNIPLNFRLHHAFMDKSGEYVMLYPPSADLQAPRSASPYYVWALATNQITALPLLAARVSGHDGIGLGLSDEPGLLHEVDLGRRAVADSIACLSVLDRGSHLAGACCPRKSRSADHQSWTHAQQGKLVPIISATYRYGLNTTDMARLGRRDHRRADRRRLRRAGRHGLAVRPPPQQRGQRRRPDHPFVLVHAARHRLAGRTVGDLHV